MPEMGEQAIARGSTSDQGVQWTGVTAWACFAALGLVIPSVLPIGGYLRNVLIHAVIMAIMVVAFRALLWTTGLANFGMSGYAAIGGYGYIALMSDYDMSFLATFLILAVVAAPIALVTSYIFLRLRGVMVAVATLAFGIAIWRVALSARFLTGGDDGRSAPSPSILGRELGLGAEYVLVVFALIAVMVVVYRIERSGYGRVLLASKMNETAASALGVDVRRHFLQMLSVTGYFVILAGAFLAMTAGWVAGDLFSEQLSVSVLLMALVGGISKPYGPLLGVFVGTALEQGLSAAQYWSGAAFAFVLLCVIVFLPDGLVQLLARATWRRRPIDGPDAAEDAGPQAGDEAAGPSRKVIAR